MTALLPCWSLHARQHLDRIPLQGNMSALEASIYVRTCRAHTLSTVLNSNTAISHPSHDLGSSLTQVRTT